MIREKNKLILPFIATLCLLYAVIVLTACGSDPGEGNGKEERCYKICIYLNDASDGVQLVPMGEASRMVRRILSDKGFGYIEYRTYGAYKKNGTLYEGDTLVYSLVFIDRANADAIAVEVKEALHLSNVLVEESTSEFHFIQ